MNLRISNAMYKFVRYKLLNEVSDGWLFMPKSVQDIIDFNLQYTSRVCTEGFTNICKSIIYTARLNIGMNSKRFFFGSHPNNYYDIAFETIANLPIDGKEKVSVWDVAYKVLQLTTDPRIEMFNKGYKIMIPSNGLTTIIFSKDGEIIDEIESDVIKFPVISKPSYKDARIMQWPGGKHWYAKIGNVDVVVNGEQKWNSFREADLAVQKFIKENYS